MLFTLADIEKQFDSAQFEKGVQLFNDQRVKAPNVQRGGELITALIQSPGSPFRVYVRSSKAANSVSINGECNCAQRLNCEHVAAVLLQALDDNQAAGANLTPKLAAHASTRSVPIPRKHTPDTPLQVLLYVLQSDDNNAGNVLIQTQVARRLKNGAYGQANYYDPIRAMRGTPARFLSSADIELLSDLQKLPYKINAGFAVLAGHPGSTQFIDAMLATGRCHYQDTNSPNLSKADPRPLTLSWSVNHYGHQQIQWCTTPTAQYLLPLSVPCYLDTETYQYGRLSSDLPDELITELITLPTVQWDKIAAVQQTLQQRYPDASVPPLHQFNIEEAKPVAPIPCLRLTSYERKLRDNLPEHQDAACLSFDYNGLDVKRHDPDVLFDGKRLIRLQRDKTAEENAYTQLLNFGLNPNNPALDNSIDNSANKSIDNAGNDTEDDYFTIVNAMDVWLDFQLQAVPKLRARGWRVVSDEQFRYPLAEAQHWYCEATGDDATSSIDEQDWFNIGLGVEIDGERIDLLPTLVQLLHQHPRGLPKQLTDSQQFTVTLEDGRLLPIPLARLHPLYHTLLELYDNTTFVKDHRICLNRIQLSRFTALDQSESSAAFKWVASDDIQQFTHRLRDINGIEAVKPPAGLQATLRPYQQRGLDWLQFLREYQLAGILADDMGLGKTIQALAHLLIEKEQGRMDRPCLVIAPTSLMFNWRQEAERFSPALKVLTLHGPRRHERFADIRHHDLILTTYPLLSRDEQTLLSHNFHLLILDEAQVIKNPKAQATAIVSKITARHRVCLTGTPMENHLGELWTLFNFLLPGLLGNSKQFRRFFRTPIEKHSSEQDAERLSRRIRPFLLRRTKDQVTAELPPKTEITQAVAMESAQQELYETVRLAMHRRVREEIQRQGIARSHIVVLDALLKLRQVCCDPRLAKMDTANNVKQSAKLSLLMALIPEMVEEGRRILVFSQFTTMLGLIEAELKKNNIAYTQLTGQTRDRETPVQRFQAGEVPVFLISLKAGGVGLNLTKADTVIHYDPWWNPAVERQATDRAHRIGQQNPVFVYKLICSGTLEEKIQAMQLRKQALADNIYQNGGGSEPQWTEQDLEQLFEPLGE